MKLKNTIAILLAAATMLTVPGCSNNEASGQNVRLTVYLCNASLLDGYAQSLQEMVPDVDLEFVVARSSVGFYLFKQQNNDLPDIITTGGFASTQETAELNQYLMDLSENETAATFYETYLESYRDNDGTVKWLPAGCNANGILANTDLFEKYNIPLPTDYPSFAAACQAFREVGIKPYTSDYKYPYTCLYTLEGWSMPQLMSRQGTSWRRNYESGLADSLDEVLWTGMFERFNQFIHDSGIGEEEITRGYTDTFNDFRDGNVAMIRGASNDLSSFSDYHGTMLLPYFGDTENDNRLLTTPRFHVALNEELNNGSQKKKDAALRVLAAMFSQESYDAMTEGDFGYMLPYNRGITSNIQEPFENLTPLIEANHMYVLLASTNLEMAASEAVHKLLSGETDAQGAYECMNALISDKTEMEPEPVITLKNAYSVTFDSKKGSEASSAIANTMRKISGSDMLLAPSSVCTGSLYAGEYTRTQLDESVQSGGNRYYTAELTGAQIRQLVTAAVEGIGYMNDPLSNQTLPVLSGFSIHVEKSDDGYHLTDIIVDGSSLTEDAVYTFEIVDLPSNFTILAEHVFGEGAIDKFSVSEEVARDLFVEYIFDNGSQPEAPTPYITFK